jgi:hypothetical protein
MRQRQDSRKAERLRREQEAEQILTTGDVAADRVVNLGLPDHEQLQLC